MADKYCKKSSLEALADEIRVRNGDSSSTKYLFPNEFESTISGLLIPTQRGAPSKELKTNDSSYTIQRGVYTGGSVFVDPVSYEGQNAINPSSSQQTISDSTNKKPIKKVVVNAANLYQVSVGNWRGTTKNPTSWSISGLPFKPVGLIFLTDSTLTSSSPYYYIRWFCALSDGTVYGYARGRTSTSKTFLGAKIVSASVTFGNSNVSFSNVICNDTGYGNQTAYIYQNSTSATSNTFYGYYIWG